VPFHFRHEGGASVSTAGHPRPQLQRVCTLPQSTRTLASFLHLALPLRGARLDSVRFHPHRSLPLYPLLALLTLLKRSATTPRSFSLNHSAPCILPHDSRRPRAIRCLHAHLMELLLQAAPGPSTATTCCTWPTHCNAHSGTLKVLSRPNTSNTPCYSSPYHFPPSAGQSNSKAANSQNDWSLREKWVSQSKVCHSQKLYYHFAARLPP